MGSGEVRIEAERQFKPQRGLKTLKSERFRSSLILVMKEGWKNKLG